MKNKLKIDKGILYILFYCVVASILHFFYPDRESTILSLLIVCSIMVDPILPCCLLLCSNIMMINIDSKAATVVGLFITLVSLYIIITSKKGYYQLWILKLTLLLLFGFVISYCFGYKTDIIVFLQMIMLALQFASIAIVVSGSDKSKYFISAFVYSGIAVCSFVFYSLATNQATYVQLIQLAYGDEEWGGSTKALSTAASVPAFVFIYSLFFKKQTYYKKIVEIIAIFALLLLIVLSYSRGVMLALFLVGIYFARIYFNKISIYRLSLFAILVFVFYLFIDSQVLDSDRLYEGFDTTGHGRTEIWGIYINRLLDEGAKGFIVGFGPGDSKRITVGSAFDGFYVHSVLLDYIFAYGLIGFYFIYKNLSFSVTNLYKSKNVFFLGFLIMQIAVYFSHGSSNNLAFNYSMALCLGMAIFDINKRKVIYGKEKNHNFSLSSKRYWRY